MDDCKAAQEAANIDNPRQHEGEVDDNDTLVYSENPLHAMEMTSSPDGCRSANVSDCAEDSDSLLVKVKHYDEEAH